MVLNLLTKLFGSKNEREMKKMQPIVAAVNDLEPKMQALDDAGLAAMTFVFVRAVAGGVLLTFQLID